jgi:hypothetical protein
MWLAFVCNGEDKELKAPEVTEGWQLCKHICWMISESKSTPKRLR